MGFAREALGAGAEGGQRKYRGGLVMLSKQEKEEGNFKFEESIQIDLYVYTRQHFFNI